MSAGGFLQVKDHPIEQQTHPHPGFFQDLCRNRRPPPPLVDCPGQPRL